MHDLASTSVEAVRSGKAAMDRFFQSATHDEALARMQYLFQQRRRVGMLLGDPGSGKSLMLSVFAQQCRREGAVVVQQNLTAVGADEFPVLLARGLGASSTLGRDMPNTWSAVADRLAEYRYQRTAVVVLLDDADRASRTVLDQVVRLIHIDGSTNSPTTVILASQRTGLAQIPRSLTDRVELRIELDAWDAEEIAAYVASQLTGGENFSLKAVQRIQALSEGVPARVSRLAELAMVAAAAEQSELVDEAAVEAVYQQLTLLLTNA